MEELLDTTQVPWSPFSTTRIYRNPKILKHCYKKYYFFNPLRINIGPYTTNKFDCSSYWKEVFARMFFKDDLLMFGAMYDELLKLAAELKGYYDMDGDVFKLSDDEFTRVMVQDGCFILGFIRYSVRDLSSGSSEFCVESPYHYDEMKSDLFLLENQIPYKALTVLMKFVPDYNWDLHIKRFIDSDLLIYSNSSSSEKKNDDDDPIPATTSHLLELLQKRLTREQHWSIRINEILTSSSTVTEVFRMDRIFFRPNSYGSLACIDFVKNGNGSYLQFPSIIVSQNTQRLLASLICQEMYSGSYKWISMYVCLLNSLIKHIDDIHLLKKHGVLIVEGYYTRDTIVDFFKHLVKYFTSPTLKKEILIFENRGNVKLKSD